MNKILVLGDGLLGSEIVKQTSWDYISRKKDHFDFNHISSYVDYFSDYDTILNCIAFTATYSDNRKLHWKTNFESVVRLARWCYAYDKKLVQISTDYLYSNSNGCPTENDIPVHCNNWYGYTKLLADGYIQVSLENYLIIRTSFKPNPFPYDEAVIQYGNFDYVDVIAELIIKLIKNNAYGVYNVGTGIKTMLQLAQKTNPNVKGTSKIIHETFPTNVSMDISKMKKFLEKHV